MDQTPENWQDRTQLLLGNENIMRLNRASVLVVGIGGVGAYAAEMLCRAGIGRLTIVDGDQAEATNLNRQLPARVSTLGQYKTEIMAERLLDIHPGLDLTLRTEYLQDQAIPELLDSGHFDCVLDAIDSLTPKIQLAAACLERKIPLVASTRLRKKRIASSATLWLVDIMASVMDWTSMKSSSARLNSPRSCIDIISL